MLQQLDIHSKKETLILSTKINQKWAIDQTIEENKRENLWNCGLGKEFLDVTPKVLSVKEKHMKVTIKRIF